MNDQEQETVQMSDEDAAAINQRIDEAAWRVAAIVRDARETGNLNFRGNVIEMIAAVVVMRYLDNEDGRWINTTVTLMEDDTP